MLGFVIDTNEYAGNFEREMCAFVTVVVGDCGVGDQHKDPENTITGVLQVADEHGCMRPCSVSSYFY